MKTEDRELGRWKKKVRDQQTKIKQLQDDLDRAYQGAEELQRITDAVLAVLAVEFGEPVSDDDTDSSLLGWRLELDSSEVSAALDKYSVRAITVPERGIYTVGVFPKLSTKI